MIRSLGSSLLAKASTGSLSRKREEEGITKPNIPGKGAVGTAGRELVETTNITPVAPGSEKVIRSAPGVESASTPGMASNQVPLVAGMGLPPAGAAAGGGAMKGNGAPSVNNQPMFQSGAPASQPGQAGRQATVASTSGAPMGSIATTRANKAAEAAKAAAPSSMGYEAPRSPTYSVGSFFPGIGSLGGRVSAAGEENVTIPKNFAQAVVATLSKPGSKGEAWATNPAVTNSGVGSISKPAATIKAATSAANNALRSVVQQATNTWNKLRSKFGW